MRISIVSTLYRSAPYLAEFHRRITDAVRQLTDDYEVVLVNDGSPDDSQTVAESLCDVDPHCRVLELSRNFGHHKAMMTGLANAEGDLVFLLDSDLEEHPEWLLRFRETMDRERADVVYGVQRTRKGGWFERTSGAAFYWLAESMCDVAVPRNVVTARLMTRDYVRSLVAHREREVFIAGLWVATGFRQVAEMVEKESSAETTYDISRKLAILFNSVTSFSTRPLVGVFALGLGIAAIALVATAWLVARKLVLGSVLSGWTSLIASVWLLGGLTICSIGIVGLYVAKTFNEVKRRPYTIVRSVTGERVPAVRLADRRAESA